VHRQTSHRLRRERCVALVASTPEEDLVLQLERVEDDHPGAPRSGWLAPGPQRLILEAKEPSAQEVARPRPLHQREVQRYNGLVDPME
jgi:hypothetical protein